MKQRNIKFKDIILENIFISSVCILVTCFFSDYSSLNSNLKINILNYFFISNFYEIFILNNLNFYKFNLFFTSFVFSLIFQIYFVAELLIKLKNLNFYLYLKRLIFLLSLLFFFYNIINQNYNLLPFDKIWLIFFYNKKVFNLKNIIILNRLSLLIIFFMLLNMYINLHLFLILIPFVIIYFIRNKKLNLLIDYKLLYVFYFFIFLFLININYISSKININLKQFNLLNVLSIKKFNKYHFTKKNFFEDERNNFYHNFCLKNLKNCDYNKEFLFYLFGDTQANQFISKIDNLTEGKLVYLKTKKQCLFLNKLKHSNPVKFFLDKNSINECNDNFINMDKIISDSISIKKKKIIFISSWYNWYYLNKLIIDKENNLIKSEDEYYKIIYNDFQLFFSKHTNRNDLKFILMLPLPTFYHSPSLCSINNTYCILKFDNYQKQVSRLEKVFFKLTNEFKNVKIFDASSVFCDPKKNICSMKGKNEDFNISYRDKENLSHYADVIMDEVFKF